MDGDCSVSDDDESQRVHETRERPQPNARRYKLPTEERLTRSAVHYLDQYTSSAENLRKVLMRKVMRAARALERSPDEFEALVDSVVEKCQRAGLVDDRNYAYIKVASLRRRGRSQRQIEARLISKGVSREIVAAALETDETSDMDAARTHARRRRLGPWRTRGVREAFRDKDMAAMCRAGFSFDVARRVVDDGGGDPEDD